MLLRAVRSPAPATTRARRRGSDGPERTHPTDERHGADTSGSPARGARRLTGAARSLRGRSEAVWTEAGRPGGGAPACSRGNSRSAQGTSRSAQGMTVAEGRGFEPRVPVKAHALSKRARSTAPASLRSRWSSHHRATPWRRGRDLNPGYACTYTGFRNRPVRPLRHPSAGVHDEERVVFAARLRLAKNSTSSPPHSSARTPPRTSARWLSRGCRSRSRTEPPAPAFGSLAP